MNKENDKILKKANKPSETYIASLLVACGVCTYSFYDRQANCISRFLVCCACVPLSKYSIRIAHFQCEH